MPLTWPPFPYLPLYRFFAAGTSHQVVQEYRESLSAIDQDPLARESEGADGKGPKKSTWHSGISVCTTSHWGFQDLVGTPRLEDAAGGSAAQRFRSIGHSIGYDGKAEVGEEAERSAEWKGSATREASHKNPSRGKGVTDPGLREIVDFTNRPRQEWATADLTRPIPRSQRGAEDRSASPSPPRGRKLTARARLEGGLGIGGGEEEAFDPWGWGWDGVTEDGDDDARQEAPTLVSRHERKKEELVANAHTAALLSISNQQALPGAHPAYIPLPLDGSQRVAAADALASGRPHTVGGHRAWMVQASLHASLSLSTRMPLQSRASTRDAKAVRSRWKPASASLAGAAAEGGRVHDPFPYRATGGGGAEHHRAGKLCRWVYATPGSSDAGASRLTYY